MRGNSCRDLLDDELASTRKMYTREWNSINIRELKKKRNALQDRLSLLQKMIDRSTGEENWACGRYTDRTILLAKINVYDELIKELWDK